MERRGASEHTMHVRDFTRIERGQVLIERGGAIEHILHVRDLARIERRQGLIALPRRLQRTSRPSS